MWKGADRTCLVWKRVKRLVTGTFEVPPDDDAPAEAAEMAPAEPVVAPETPAVDPLADALELPAANCLAIEDSRNGLLSAHAAGIETIVTPGIYTRGEQFAEAALVVDDLTAVNITVAERLLQ